MGEVYRATDSHLKRAVAIKVLPASVASDADRLARFQREAEVLAALNHPNIAAIYGLEKTPDLTALVIELVEGEDLSAMIGRGPIAVADALPMAKQIADALEAAHEQGIIHRDLKPQNIKVRTDGTVKVLDFGLAKALDANTSGATADAMNSPTLTNRATQMGVIIGTAAYMAPEQARGRAVDTRADIWSFGVVLYEMLTGRRAFEGDDISITLASVLKEDVHWGALPKNLSSPIQRLLRRCLEKDPRRRLQAIGEARITIEDVIAGPGREASDAPQSAPLQSGGLAWKIAAGLLAATAVALGIVAVQHVREQAPVMDVVRFPIAAPEGSGAGQPTVSPDGRQVAFVASATRQLWVHSLESAVSWPLPGTEGVGSHLFWSPDSRYIAFRRDRKLQKIAVAGGRPELIADLPGDFSGGTWGREGVIVFGGSQGLMQVPEAGGTATILIPLDPSQTDDQLGLPTFLPDGRRFVYSRWPFDPARIETYLGSLDPAQARKRLQDAIGVVLGYAASPDPGLVYLLLGRPGALSAHAFDLRRLETTGDAIRIAAAVDAEELRFASTSTTGVLAYETPGAPGKFQLTWFDRTGKTLGTESLAGDLQAPNLSRDGQRLAIERRDGGNSDIWVIDLSRGTTTRVTTDPGHDIRPVLSPDGSRVAFSRGGIFYQKSANGAGEEERLGDGQTMDWSPDGRFISFFRDLDLWALPLFGDRTPILVAGGKFNERRGRFSPDGKWIAYESNVSGRFEIYLQSFPPEADRVQTISVNGGDSAYWRGDGKELFFHAPDDHIMAVDIRSGPAPAPGVPRALFRLPADVNNGRFVTTPDGQRFLVPLEVQKPTPGEMMIMLNWLHALQRSQTTGK
jgi:eukaryotic-like serine/threonine-protein kinase